MAKILDPEHSFELLKDGVVNVLKDEYFPNGEFKGKRRTLKLSSIEAQDSTDFDDYTKQQQVREKDGTWSIPLKAKFDLIDNASGKKIDSKAINIASLPKLTPRFGFIVDGKERQVDHQSQLKDGIFTRVPDNGAFVESVINTAGPDKRRDRMRVAFDPETHKYVLKHGTTNVNLLPVLNALGVDEDQVQKAWGKEILDDNKAGAGKADLAKLYKSFYRKSPETDEEMFSGLKEKFSGLSLDPEVTSMVVGKEYKQVSGEALLDSATAALKITRGEAKPTGYDDMRFKRALHTEDYVPERLRLASRGIKAKIAQNVDRMDDIERIVARDTFNRPIKQFFNSSQLSVLGDQTNPLGMITGHTKHTIMGEGGISSPHQVSMDAKIIHPSSIGFLDPLHTPESARTGINLQLPMTTWKEGNELVTAAVNAKTGKLEKVRASKLASSNLAFPDQYKNMKPGLKPSAASTDVTVANKDGEMSQVKPGEVDYILPSHASAFSVTTNLIPFLQNNNGNRVGYSTQQQHQALSLRDREAPLVQSAVAKGEDASTFEDVVGKVSGHNSKVSGIVTKVTDRFVEVKDGKGKKTKHHTYKHFPLNNKKGYLSSYATVKPGDEVKKGQSIADNNFMKGGKLALGTNLDVGYVPADGYNFEDGIVISESAAQKLTSKHMYKKEFRNTQNSHVGARKFRSHYPTAFKKDQLEHMGDDGVIKEGSTVKPGDPLLLAVRKNEVTSEAEGLAKLSKGLVKDWKDSSLSWEGDTDGKVVKVVRTGKKIKVHVRADESMQVGDKLVGRHGNKGIVTKVLPDHEMPEYTDQISGDKKNLQVMLNPLGVPGRINPGQTLETAASWIAKKTGKPYKVKNFDADVPDYAEKVQKELKQHGLSDTSEITDPKTGKKIGKVLVGTQHMLKLDQQVSKKMSARSAGYGNPYDVNKAPTTGGGRLGSLGNYAMLAHGATHNLREMQTYKSSAQDEVWRSIQMGDAPPAPRTPYAYEKLEGYMKGLGINISKEGNQLVLEPLTDKHVAELSNGEVKDPGRMIRGKDLKSEKGGLFDPKVFGRDGGGLKGTKWGHIELDEAMPNPVFEKAILTLTGMKGKEFEKVLGGEKEIDGKTGPKAIGAALDSIDVGGKLKDLEAGIKKAPKSKIDLMNRQIRYLRNLDKLGVTPREAYMRKKVPILPPMMRPLSALEDGSLNTDDLNALYKGVGLINSKLKDMDPDLKKMPEETAKLHIGLYDGMKALTGVGTLPDFHYAKKQRLRGIVGKLEGKDPYGKGQVKEGFFQKTVMSRKQDLSMRSTIVPNQRIKLDEVAMPKEGAQQIFKPHLVRELRGLGLTTLQAHEAIKTNDKRVDVALDRVMRDTPVLLKRDPVLHKFGVMAFKPKLSQGKAIEIHPLVTGGFNADFDGDSVDLDTTIPMRIRGQVCLLTGRELIDRMSIPEGDFIAVPVDTEVLGSQGWVATANISFHRCLGKKKYKVVLRNGYSFIVSEDHSLMVGKEEVKPTEISIGTELDHMTPAPEKTDHQYEEGVRFGHFLGDGCAEPRSSGGGRLSIACKPDEEREYLKELWSNVDGVRKITDCGYGWFQIHNKELAEEMLVLCGRYSHGKRIHEELLSRSDEFLNGLLSGYIMSDGSVEVTRSGSVLIRTWSKSKKLRDGMAFVALLLGLPHSVRERVKGEDCYYLLSLGKEAIEHLDYRCPGKKGLLVQWAKDQYENNRKDSRAPQSRRGYEVFSIEEVEYEDRMVDIEVRTGEHVFGLCGGILVHNTMAVFAPITTEAKEEAKRMLPSNNLFDPKNGNTMYVPGHEAMAGVHRLSQPGKKTGLKFSDEQTAAKALEDGKIRFDDQVKISGKPTTIGRVMLDRVLPKDMRGRIADSKQPVDKKFMGQMLKEIAENNPKAYPDVVQTWKDMGNDTSTKTGMTLSLDDIRANTKLRDDFFAPYKKKEAQIKATSGLTKKEKNEKVVELYRSSIEKFDKVVYDDLRKRGSSMMAMLDSGGMSGSKRLAVKQMSGAPVMFEDAKGDVIPVPVLKSYSEGLTMADYMTGAQGARMGTLSKSQGTSAPGALSKRIINSTMNILVGTDDCKTGKGVLMDVKDPDLVDRYTATSMKAGRTTIPPGTLLTPDVKDKLRGNGINKVHVRTPLKCAHGEGICQKCAGLGDDGRPWDIGTNIGVIAAQSMGEPTTQMSMNSFHTGGVVSPAKGFKETTVKGDTFTNMRTLLFMPSTIQNSAKLAPTSGKISNVRKDPAGGFRVYVAGQNDAKDLWVPQLKRGIKTGKTVKAGDPLSPGMVNPRELLPLAGLDAVKGSLTNQIHGAYGGVTRRRHIEVAVRAMTDLAKVKETGDQKDVLPGDVMSASQLNAMNARLKPGQKPAVFQPVLKGMEQLPLEMQEDWAARMNFTKLKDTVVEGALKGWKSDIHGRHPVPGMMYGAEFGRGPNKSSPY